LGVRFTFFRRTPMAAQTSTTSPSSTQSAEHHGQDPQASGNAIDVLRGSVVNVLDSVVREYEPQIAAFTANIAHEAVDRGVEFAQTAVSRVKAQSWLRIGVAAALGIGIIAVLGYEAEQAATAPLKRPVH
jgi:hypothetical protein